MNQKIKWVCPNCESDQVSKDACVRWSVENQKWEVTAIYDNAYCDTCGSELKYLDDIEVKE